MHFDPHPIRWIEIVLPHPEVPDRWLTLKADGPFALRPWYFAPGTRTEIRLHLHRRTSDGGLKGCLHCGAEGLYTRKRIDLRVLGLAIGVATALGALVGLIWGFWATLFIAWAIAGVIVWKNRTPEVVCYACGTRAPRLPGRSSAPLLPAG